MGGVGADLVYGIDVDAAGNSYVTRTITGKVYVEKRNADGSINATYDVCSAASVVARDLRVDNDGYTIVVGEFKDQITFGANVPIVLTSLGDYDIFIARVTPLGDVLWARALGGVGADNVGAVDVDAVGTAYVVGDFHITPFPYSGAKIVIASYTKNGEQRWFTSTRTNGNSHFGNGIVVDSSGVGYIAGSFFGSLDFSDQVQVDAGNIESNGYLAKFDASGLIQWCKSFGASSGYGGCSAVARSADGGAVLTGPYHGDFHFGSITIASSSGIASETFVANCSSTGTFRWAVSSVGQATPYAIATTPQNTVCVTGVFSLTVAFGATSFTSAGGSDVFVECLDTNGSVKWAVSAGGTAADQVHGIRSTESGIRTCGQFQGQCNFGSSLKLQAVDSATSDGFVATIGFPTSVQPDETEFALGTCYPNPAITSLHLQGYVVGDAYEILDVEGMSVTTGWCSANGDIEVDQLQPGMYVVRSRSMKGVARMYRFVKR